MTAQELRVEREELVAEGDFPNRWSAMIYQWCRDELGFVPDDADEEVVAEDCREFVLARGVPEERVAGINFGAIAYYLMFYSN